MSRRQAVGALGAFGVLVPAWLTGCKDSEGGTILVDEGGTVESGTGSGVSGDTQTNTSQLEAGSCTLIPTETEGPYPLSAVLSNMAMVRRDITEGRSGVPLTVRLKLVDISNGCAPINQAASIYIWHCDKDGVYSGYSQPGANTIGETFMRGIQDVDENGEVTFTTIYPGWYNGRITHIHFQVFLYSSSVATATSQIAFPQAITTEVYNSTQYTNGQNTSVRSFGADNVFSDGTEYQMATLTGNLSDGYTAFLQAGVAL